MKKMGLFLLAFGLARASVAQPMEHALDSVMTAFQRMHRFNGSVLVAENGRILLEKGYGLKDFQSKEKNDSATIFMIASMTKPFTATVALQLVAQGKLKLSDPVSKYFSAYPNGNKITIRHLLTHTAGIPDYTQDSAFMATHKNLSVSAALIAYGKSDFDPGTDWKYSNQGYQLLGEIVAKASGLTYYRAVRHYIFDPLQMTSSGFDFTGLKSGRKAIGYWTWPERGENEKATLIDSGTSFAAGAIYSTVCDLYKWHLALQSGRMVSKALLEEAYTPVKNHYGFGWFVDSLFGHRVLSHSGDTWGFKSNIARITNDDVCIILLNNVEDEEMRGPITETLLAALFNQPYQLPVFHQQIPLADSVLKGYAGTYQFQGLTLIVTFEDGQLWVQPQGGPRSAVYPETTTSFFSRVVDAEITFVVEDQGQVSGVKISQGGREMEGKRTQ